MRRFDYGTIHGEIITACQGENPDIMNDGSFCCDRIILKFWRTLLEISVDVDTEELNLKLHDADRMSAGMYPDIGTFLNVAGYPVARAWTAVNPQGYEDTFILALGDAAASAVDPAYMFVGTGPSISVYGVERLKRPLEFALELPH